MRQIICLHLQFCVLLLFSLLLLPYIPEYNMLTFDLGIRCICLLLLFFDHFVHLHFGVLLMFLVVCDVSDRLYSLSTLDKFNSFGVCVRARSRSCNFTSFQRRFLFYVYWFGLRAKFTSFIAGTVRDLRCLQVHMRCELIGFNVVILFLFLLLFPLALHEIRLVCSISNDTAP